MSGSIPAQSETVHFNNKSRSQKVVSETASRSNQTSIPTISKTPESSQTVPAIPDTMQTEVGGYILAVPGAEGIQPPFERAIVSIRAESTVAPCVSPVGDDKFMRKWKATIGSPPGFFIFFNIFLVIALVPYFIGEHETALSGLQAREPAVINLSREQSDSATFLDAGPKEQSIDRHIDKSELQTISRKKNPKDTFVPRRVKVERFRVGQKEVQPDKTISSFAKKNEETVKTLLNPLHPLQLLDDTIIIPRVRPSNGLRGLTDLSRRQSGLIFKEVARLRNNTVASR